MKKPMPLVFGGDVFGVQIKGLKVEVWSVFGGEGVDLREGGGRARGPKIYTSTRMLETMVSRIALMLGLRTTNVGFLFCCGLSGA